MFYIKCVGHNLLKNIYLATCVWYQWLFHRLDVLVKVDRYIFPVDFIILDVEEDSDIHLILGRPFVAIEGHFIDVYDGKMILIVDNEQDIFNVELNSEAGPTTFSIMSLAI